MKICFPIGQDSKIWCNYKNSSCYSYALNVFTNDRLYVGDLLNKRISCFDSDEYLIWTMSQEVSLLGGVLSKCSNEIALTNSEFKICLVRESVGRRFYHFFRQEEDGFWSHKMPMELPQFFDGNGNRISDPIKCAERGYDFVSFFKIKKLL